MRVDRTLLAGALFASLTLLVPSADGKSGQPDSESNTPASNPLARETAARVHLAQEKRQKSPRHKQTKIRVFTAELRGSLCPACLKSLEKHLLKTRGVHSVHMIKPHPADSSENRFAVVSIRYNSPPLKAKRLKGILRFRDFDVSKVTDRQADWAG